MASLEKRYDGRYLIGFCTQGERRCRSLGKTPEREDPLCLVRLEDSLRFVDRGLLEVPLDADLGRFLVSDGKQGVNATLETPLTLGELFKRNETGLVIGVKKSSFHSA